MAVLQQYCIKRNCSTSSRGKIKENCILTIFSTHEQLIKYNFLITKIYNDKYSVKRNYNNYFFN